MDRLSKTAFTLKSEMQGNLLKLSIRLSITALLKLNLHRLFPLLISDKIPK